MIWAGLETSSRQGADGNSIAHRVSCVLEHILLCTCATLRHVTCQVFGPNKFFHFLWMMPYLAKRPMAWLEFAVSLARDTWQNARWFGPWLEAKRGWLLFPIHVEHLRDQPPWSLSFWPNKVRT